MEYDVRIEPFAGRPLAVVRRQATLAALPRVIPDACGAVWNVVRAEKIPGAGRHVAVYLDDTINLEVGVELDAPIVGYDEVVGSSLPAGSVVTTVHFGPYGRLGEAHEAIHKWSAQQGHTLVRPCWELYGHWVNEWNDDPSKIRTDVFYLLKTDSSA
jgi:effector-binding domain-containing protein